MRIPKGSRKTPLGQAVPMEKGAYIHTYKYTLYTISVSISAIFSKDPNTVL